ncbi:MAG: hypothetical protein GY847_16830 [Proteobacteria bacterium]|nr:hypothetical protein [Pseudomonadota bacterium]
MVGFWPRRHSIGIVSGRFVGAGDGGHDGLPGHAVGGGCGEGVDAGIVVVPGADPASPPSSNADEPRARFRSACVRKAASPAAASHTVGGAGGVLGQRPRNRSAYRRSICGFGNGDRAWSPQAFFHILEFSRTFRGKNRLQKYESEPIIHRE